MLRGGRRKGRLPFFQTENGTDDAEREQRVLARSAEPQGGKACKAGLKRKTENDETTIHYITVGGGVVGVQPNH